METDCALASCRRDTPWGRPCQPDADIPRGTAGRSETADQRPFRVHRLGAGREGLPCV